MVASIEGQQQLSTQRVATNVLADDKKVQAKVAKKLAKQQVSICVSIVYLYQVTAFSESYTQ